MPRIPGLSELLALLQTQTEALAQLPRTLSDLNGTVRDLTAATTSARETIESAQRMAERLETLVDGDPHGAVALALFLRDLRGALGQVTNVTDAGLDHEIGPQVARDGLGLRRRFDDYELHVGGHVSAAAERRPICDRSRDALVA